MHVCHCMSWCEYVYATSVNESWILSLDSFVDVCACMFSHDCVQGCGGTCALACSFKFSWNVERDIYLLRQGITYSTNTNSSYVLLVGAMSAIQVSYRSMNGT